MKLKSMAMGPYQTNCYILTLHNYDIIIDPGVDALGWIQQTSTNPIAILNTHGHFDHVWSNSAVQKEYNIPIYAPKDDVFMIQNDPFSQGTPPSHVDVQVKPDETITLDETEITFTHFPGHTPGCSAIIINNYMFSGDFIFDQSIGRVDFPYSDPVAMKESITKVLAWEENYQIYPGHGNSTTLQAQKASLKAWINYI